MKFLVEKVERDLIFDFTFILKKCKEYYDWLGEPFEIKYCNNEIPHNFKDYDKYIPVGSIEFVSNYLKDLKVQDFCCFPTIRGQRSSSI